MLYLIDGNNLAGELEILGEKDFDKKLIGLIEKKNQVQPRRVVLVFDSVDRMGDKFEDGKITIIYAPQDDYYQGADNKIIELAEIYDKEKNNVFVVTNDIDLGEKVKKINDFQNNIKIIKARDFAKIFDASNSVDNKIDSETEAFITEEFLDLWGGN